MHRLVEGRPLWLGGVEFEHDHGLDGHSDADVLMHAICDAVLGALELQPAEGGADDDAEIDALGEARNAARAAKDWAEADRVRDELSARGVVVEDTSDGGTSWFRK